ncbi:MAG: YtxH domain-containing protein [Actinobacteria bacterium]|nr:YtxH domain-containing protein [Actinomycetota bacterium]
MSDQTRVATAAAIGAVIGGVAAYLLLTSQGRHVRTRVNPTLDDLWELLRECRRAIRKSQQVGREAGGVVQDLRTVIAGAELPPDL